MGGLRKLFDLECLEKHPNEQGCPASRLFLLASVCFEIDVSNGGDPARVNKPTQPTELPQPVQPPRSVQLQQSVDNPGLF
jgi:hypothetical protein